MFDIFSFSVSFILLVHFVIGGGGAGSLRGQQVEGGGGWACNLQHNYHILFQSHFVYIHIPRSCGYMHQYRNCYIHSLKRGILGNILNQGHK